ncbi:aminoglycoside 3'-phosphotransferase [Microbacterium sp. C7(2022)]|uniref:aminoglycoside 3'-phosphotransferase n=1 Tax=Microbacterium sp. C7(2022) TaxID=2992759 RepID=UPI00237BDAF7|nr:aminoglycoside 3'-phosphotransferase [Microbacterium sp. C7(2022)]MDE0547448.1 aminoglycoside 3'-phosphotransferase [Microbacterium sp. C7(2022)]
MSIPLSPVEVPARVRELARGADLEPVWINGVGGVTFRTSDGRHIKYGPRHAETSFTAEADRLRWAAVWVTVPEIVSEGNDETHEWLVTTTIPGESAVAPRWVEDAAVAVRAVGEGLRALHDTLPVAECPFDWNTATRIANAATRGIRIPDHLLEAPPVDRLVVCHGDACSPNTLIGDDGRWVGHVDFGALGVADRWADLAVAAWSTEWNYGPGWEGALYDAYGITPDAERIAYYRALWDAT